MIFLLIIAFVGGIAVGELIITHTIEKELKKLGKKVKNKINH